MREIFKKIDFRELWELFLDFLEKFPLTFLIVAILGFFIVYGGLLGVLIVTILVMISLHSRDS